MAGFRPSERGFILIAAIWLLILCGSIAALVLARSMNGAAASAADAESLRARLALEAAVETAVADLLINGARSRFSMLPSASPVPVGDVAVTVRASAESGRLDLNSADPKRVERLLAATGRDSAARAPVLARLAAAREKAGGIRNLDAMRHVLGAAPADREAPCLEDLVTVFSGRAKPDPAHVPAPVARALGTAPGGGGPLSAGTPVRLEARTGGRTLTAIIRVGGLIERPVLRMAWEFDASCAAAEF